MAGCGVISAEGGIRMEYDLGKRFGLHWLVLYSDRFAASIWN